MSACFKKFEENKSLVTKIYLTGSGALTSDFPLDSVCSGLGFSALFTPGKAKSNLGY